jgi:hypothetical protein
MDESLAMRIAYVSLHWPRTITSGVGKKMSDQLQIWRELGHEAQLFMHTHPYPDQKLLLPAQVIEYQTVPGIRGKIKTETNRIDAISRLIKAVEAYRPDVIYLRSGMYAYPLHKLFQVAPVVMEINSNDVSEHRHLGIVYYFYNRLTRNIDLSRAAGLVSVSRELLSLPVFNRYGKLTRVIANGIDLSRVMELPAPNNSRPRLVFIGTPGYPWHGVEKLAMLANSFPDLMIDVIGYDTLGAAASMTNVVLHGYLTSQSYQQIIGGADVAIGSLALHRNNLNEASPLKTRECLAYGLPSILPYIDTDLDEVISDTLLKIPNQEDNVLNYGRAIYDFAYRMRGRRIDRQLIGPLIDMHAKETKRIDFFEEIISKR